MPAKSDALVFFGITGDLARKKIFPALYAMVRRGKLDVPVIGAASSDLTVDQLRARAEESIRAAFRPEPRALTRLLGLLRYAKGDYSQPATFHALKRAVDGCRRPAHYLAIPPAAFETVIEGLRDSGLSKDARIIIEKPFGRDLASARRLNAAAQAAFPETSIFRIDHYLGKEAIENLLYFRFANSFVEPIWNRDHVASVQITLAENFGVDGRGRFYDGVGCLRDVVQNHMLQIVALLAMEPPATRDSESLRDEKAKVFKAMRPPRPRDLVRGQFVGYQKEPGVDRGSDTETFCALRLSIDSWRWQGVPWYLRAGKNLPQEAAEVLVEFKRPPHKLFCEDVPPRANYLRFRLAPCPAIALAARVKRAGPDFVGEQKELFLLDAQADEQLPYERLLGDALAGSEALFSRQDSIEAAWAVLEPVLRRHAPALPYKPGTWGPKEADALIARDGGWLNPVAAAAPRRTK